MVENLRLSTVIALRQRPTMTAIICLTGRISRACVRTVVQVFYALEHFLTLLQFILLPPVLPCRATSRGHSFRGGEIK